MKSTLLGADSNRYEEYKRQMPKSIYTTMNEKSLIKVEVEVEYCDNPKKDTNSAGKGRSY